MPEAVEAREAAWGSRMIEIRVRFWTNGIAEGKGKVLPRHAWSGGVVRMAPNSAHGIKPKGLRTFNSMAELGTTIERVLVDHGVKIHPCGNLYKLIARK